jgi:hypothetical protein
MLWFPEFKEAEIKNMPSSNTDDGFFFTVQQIFSIQFNDNAYLGFLR